MNGKSFTCALCGKERRMQDGERMHTVRPGVQELIIQDHPDVSQDAIICRQDLKRYRQHYIESIVAAERGELTKLDHEVIKSMVDYEILARNVDAMFDRKLTFGERASDAIADFGGSWTFIISFGVAMFAWIALNVWLIAAHPFDPYPFILLNLVLSTLAAIQAPIIMMSQNRKEDKDRLRSENDYKVNLKAELQIRNLSEKVDYLIQQQWQHLLEIQQLQIDLLQKRPKP